MKAAVTFTHVYGISLKISGLCGLVHEDLRRPWRRFCVHSLPLPPVAGRSDAMRAAFCCGSGLLSHLSCRLPAGRSHAMRASFSISWAVDSSDVFLDVVLPAGLHLCLAISRLGAENSYLDVNDRKASDCWPLSEYGICARKYSSSYM
jgi:hypothetical protein